MAQEVSYAVRKGLENRAEYPAVEYLAEEELTRLLQAANAACNNLHGAWVALSGKSDPDEPEDPAVRAARLAYSQAGIRYFMLRLEYDYRQATAAKAN